MGAVQFGTYTLSGRGDPESYTGCAITPSLLPLLGLQPVVGRTFADGEDKPGAAPVALISEALWRRRFGADPAILGQPATINGIAYTIVGVAPAALPVLTTGDVWVPLVIDPARAGRSALGAAAVVAAAAVFYVLFAYVERTGRRKQLHQLSEQRGFALELRISLLVLFALGALATSTRSSIMLAGFALGIAVGAVW